MVDFASLNDACGTHSNLFAGDHDPAIAPGELSADPSVRAMGRIAPIFGGHLVERFGRKANGGWQRYRIFVAPGVYLVERWDER